MDIPLPYRILAVDPATTTSGWAMLEVTSLHPLKITVVKTNQIEGQKLLREKKSMSKLFSKQFCVVDALEHEYVKLIEEWSPHIVVSEGAFMYRHVSAAIALTLAIHALRRATFKTTGKDIGIIAPTLSKKSFTGSGAADKDKMRECYNNSDYLLDKPENISEHEIDAISHGVAGFKLYVIGDLSLITVKKTKT